MKLKKCLLILPLIFFCTLVFSETSWADFLYKGYVTKTEDQFFLKDEYTNKDFLVSSRLISVWEKIKTLETGDYISGFAYAEVEDRIYIRSIDSAGLKKVLGLWVSGKYIVQFEDFNNVNFWNLASNGVSGPFHFSYYITQGDDGNWKVLFADDERTMIASLVCITDLHIRLSFFDLNTGAPSQVYDLERP